MYSTGISFSNSFRTNSFLKNWIVGPTNLCTWEVSANKNIFQSNDLSSTFQFLSLWHLQVLIIWFLTTSNLHKRSVRTTALKSVTPFTSRFRSSIFLLPRFNNQQKTTQTTLASSAMKAGRKLRDTTLDFWCYLLCLEIRQLKFLKYIKLHHLRILINEVMKCSIR